MDYTFGAGLAVWFGLLTSISPCPLATNITAMTYIGKKISSIKATFITGLLYACGRAFAYMIIALIIVKSALSIPTLSQFFQIHFNKIVGPVLIVAGMFLLELITLSFRGSNVSGKLQPLIARSQLGGAFLLGTVFALSFCPVSAALYFGSLIPLSIKYSSAVMYPALYGLGTALPVVIFAIFISAGSNLITSWYEKIYAIERWMRLITGLTFVIVGIYFTLVFIFNFQIF